MARQCVAPDTLLFQLNNFPSLYQLINNLGHHNHHVFVVVTTSLRVFSLFSSQIYDLVETQIYSVLFSDRRSEAKFWSVGILVHERN